MLGHNIAPCGSIILYIVGLRISARRSTAGEATPLEKDALTPKPGSPIMMVPKANRLATYKYLFNGESPSFSSTTIGAFPARCRFWAPRVAAAERSRQTVPAPGESGGGGGKPATEPQRSAQRSGLHALVSSCAMGPRC